MSTKIVRSPGASARGHSSGSVGTDGSPQPPRDVFRLKVEHLIVLQALEDANRSLGRAVRVSEVAEKVSAKDKRRLERTYAYNLNKTVVKILWLLIARGLVFSHGGSRKLRLYGSANVLDPRTTSAPQLLSRRGRVLALVRDTVQALGRAVRNSDVLEHVESSEQAAGLSEADITHDILSFAETGEITVVGRVRGEGKGVNLYLPSDLDPNLYKPNRPLTWLDEVGQTVETLWAERAEEARARGARPKPLTTGDVRARVINSQFHTQREMKDPQVLVDAVKHLAESRDPLLRKIKRQGQRLLLWVPVGVADEDVDFSDLYANDAERMGAAVERGVERHGRPVTIRDIQAEVEADPALRPVNSSDIFQALSYAARETFDAYNGKGRQKRRARRVRKIGRAGPNTYYHTNDGPAARAFVEFCRIELAWSEANPEGELEALQTASLPIAARGRALLLAQEMEPLRQALSELLTITGMDGTTRREAEDLKERIAQAAEAALGSPFMHVPDGLALPSEVMTALPCWTAAEFLEVIKPLYPMAENIKSDNKFITLMHDRVRRVPNPEFENRFSDDPRKAAEFLFDRTDALLYAAKQWGGPECCLQATLAACELGRLRDPRFVVPALDSKSFEMRLAGVACLAFLWSDEGNRRLKFMASDDPDPGVRQSALWAYGFSGGEEAREMLSIQARTDPNSRVREFASQALEADDGSWWRM